MERLKFVLLAVDNNDYQVEQVSSSQSAASKLGIEIEIIHTEHDSIQQSQIVLDLIQRPPSKPPSAIFFEPVSTALAQPARAAAAAKLGWVVLNRENLDYVRELREVLRHNRSQERRKYSGRADRQVASKGRRGPAHRGPGDNNAEVRRSEGMLARKPPNVEVRELAWALDRGQCLPCRKFVAEAEHRQRNSHWGCGRPERCHGSWCPQAFHELPNGPARVRWLQVPFIGCDGLPNGGQKAVREHRLAATVVIPPNAGDAVEAMAAAIRRGRPTEVTLFTQAGSFPPLHALASQASPGTNRRAHGLVPLGSLPPG